MEEMLFDALGELAGLVVTTIGSGIFMVIGFFGEQAGLAQVMGGGDAALGAWELFIGTWAVFVGLYLLGYKQALPRLREFSDRVSN